MTHHRLGMCQLHIATSEGTKRDEAMLKSAKRWMIGSIQQHAVDTKNFVETVFVKKPPTAPIWRDIGRACWHLRQYNEAEEALAYANMLDPKDGAVWLLIADIASRQDRGWECNNALRRALRFGIQDESIVLKLASLFFVFTMKLMRPLIGVLAMRCCDELM